jgi:hypothetical protein
MKTRRAPLPAALLYIPAIVLPLCWIAITVTPPLRGQENPAAAKDTAAVHEKGNEAEQKEAPKEGGKGQAIQEKGAGPEKTGSERKQKDARAETSRGKAQKGKAAVAGKSTGTVKGKNAEKGKVPGKETIKNKTEAGKLPAAKERPAAVDIRDMGKAGKSDKSPGKEIPADLGKDKDKAPPEKGKDIHDKSAFQGDKKDKEGAPAEEDAAKAGEGEVPPVPQAIVINPGDPSVRSMWPDVYERSSIFYWGKRKGMILEDDRGPVIDGVAGFVSRYGTRITVEGLMRERKYTLLIDFVRFKDYSSAMYPTTLKIFIKNPETSNQELLESLDYPAILRNEPPYRKEIPFKYTVKGAVELMFREYSPINGFWGMWDMAVTDSGRYPGEPADTAKQPADKEQKAEPGEKDHIVEIQ